MRTTGIALLVAGVLMILPLPAILILLHFRHIESLPAPTPEDLSAGVASTKAVALGGFLLLVAGLALVLKSPKRGSP